MVIWSRLAGMRFCPALPGSRQRYKLFINYILRLHVKRFIPARRDPSFVQPGSCLTGTKFSHVIASARLGRIKKLIKKISTEYQGRSGPYFCSRKPSFRKESVMGPISRMIGWNRNQPWKYELVANIRFSRWITNSHLEKSSEIGIRNSHPK